jgi:hypothetical protein
MGRFAFESYGVEVAVEWEAEELDTRMAALLLPTWSPGPTLRPDAVFRLAKDGSLTAPSSSLDIHHRDDPVETIERHLHLYLASETRQVVYVHAGVVAWQGRALLFPGRSWAGKSSLVMALVGAGAVYLSDEYAIIDPQGWVFSFPRPLSLRGSHGSRRVEASELGWRADIPALRVAAVIITEYCEHACWQPSPISAGEAVLDLMANTVSAREAPDLALTCLSMAIPQAVTWKSPRGQADRTAKQILHAVESATPGPRAEERR